MADVDYSKYSRGEVQRNEYMKEFFLERKVSLLLSLAVAVVFLLYCMLLISKGHFHEDAYIMFIYVENLLNGEGITYFPGGGHIEGATDFFWLVLLAVLGKVGFSTGTSAIVLNSVGVFIICSIISRTILSSGLERSVSMILMLPFIVLWIYLGPLVAAVGGFSVFLYMAMVLVNFYTVFRPKYVTYTPYVSIVVALFRPDGVIIGVGFTLIGLYFALKHDKLRSYLIGMAIGAFVGLAYFAWRFSYFGNVLPLPLYVKGGGSIIAGLGSNVEWLTTNWYVLLPLLGLLMMSGRLKYFLFITLPVIVLFIALIAATQSQNIGDRFQAPIFIVAYYVLVVLILDSIRKLRSQVVAIGLVVGYIVGAIPIIDSSLYAARSVTRFNYFNQMPLVINTYLPDRQRIALTEAGRMAYWNQKGGHEIIDLVGLNTVYPAKNMIGVDYLESLDPDVLMYHHAGMLNTKWLDGVEDGVISLTVNRLENVDEWSAVARKRLTKARNASVVATQFLREHFDEYDVFLVDYAKDGTYAHVYGFRKTIGIKDEMLAEFRLGLGKETALSYYDMLDRVHGEHWETPGRALPVHTQ